MLVKAYDHPVTVAVCGLRPISKNEVKMKQYLLTICYYILSACTHEFDQKKRCVCETPIPVGEDNVYYKKIKGHTISNFGIIGKVFSHEIQIPNM